MNRFQKVAAKIAKYEVKKDNDISYRLMKNAMYNFYKKERVTIQHAISLKNFNNRINF